MIGFKLFRKRKDGTLGPLFINRRQVLDVDTWYDAEEHRTPGYAFRPGWHVMAEKSAPHLSKKGRVWARVEIDGFILFERPKSQGGLWYLAERMRILEVLS